MICHQCRTEIKVQRFVSRTDECPRCGSDVHCCLNCSNYDPAMSNHCREPNAEWVSDREKANFCDFFTPGGGQAHAARPQVSRDEAKKAFDSLFKT
jgi:hypothetical protein